MAEQQDFNSLDRFRKKPGRLVLEEHGHCEVPAGCGGVVLRWRNPHAIVPVTIHIYCPCPITFLLDGSPLPSARIDLAPGPHVATFSLREANLAQGLIMFAATHDPKQLQAQPSGVADQPIKIVSSADGTWKYSLNEPSPEWTTVAFDDREWTSLVWFATPKTDYQDQGHYACRTSAEAGAACLGVGPLQRDKGEENTSVWIRKVCEIPAPQ